jgi:2-polyprenyl-3-methyl-5-hydroxy-6-metoxy-1,4-benzoquinol methylase
MYLEGNISKLRVAKLDSLTDKFFYRQCPCCYSDEVHKQLTALDYTVSKEPFEIWNCRDCTLRFTQNIPSETSIGRYYQSENYISHTDTNKGTINRLYRLARRFTLRNKKNTIASFSHLSKGKLLDVGAGTGAFASYMQESGWIVNALEPDTEARKKAADLHSIRLEEPSRLFELDENHYDVITLWHVLEHVHTLHQYLDQLKRILKPGGSLFIAVPNYTSYDANKYGQFWAAYDVPRHLYHFSPMAMRNLLQQHGLQLKKIKPMWLDSFYVSMLSEKYKSGRSNLIKGFWNGAVSNWKAFSKHEQASSLIYVISKMI